VQTKSGQSVVSVNLPSHVSGLHDEVDCIRIKAEQKNFCQHRRLPHVFMVTIESRKLRIEKPTIWADLECRAAQWLLCYRGEGALS
jgi:hypothetical protein